MISSIIVAEGGMPAVEIRLLGAFELRSGGALVTIKGQKDRALLAYLAMTPNVEHRRERLAGILWGGSDEAHSRDSLKHALGRLRQALGPRANGLTVGRDTVVFDSQDIWIDAAEFMGLAEAEAQEPLNRALSLYRGELLHGDTLDEPGFCEWLMTERERHRQIANYAAGRLLAHYAESGRSEDAADAARRALLIDPQSERACRLLMRALTEIGDRSRALKTYHDFARRLEIALDIVPETETTRLFQAIRTGAAVNRTAIRLGVRPDARPPEVATADLRSRPTIAVLAFNTLGSAEGYFTDGVTEEIITALSRVRGIDLIARNSSFAMREAPDPRETGRILGVRYLVQGSLMRNGERVRINVSLLDAPAGTVLWSESFQDSLSDIFELQDRIAARVVGTLLPTLEAAEIERSSRKVASLDAYDYHLRGLAEMHRWTEEASRKAIVLFGNATEIDPGYAPAYAMAVRCYSQRKACGWDRDHEAETTEAVRLARQAVRLAGDDALVLTMAGIGMGFVAGQPEQGVRLIERALRLNPNLAIAWMFSGWVHVWLGMPETAVEHVERAMRLSPRDPQFAMMQTAMACAHFFLERPGEAVAWVEQAVMIQPNYWIAWCVLAAARAEIGDTDGARTAMARVLEIAPSLRADNLTDAFPIRGAKNTKRWTEALLTSGLPA